MIPGHFDPKAHERAILELPLDTLVREILLGMDINTIELTPGGGYRITIPYGPHSLVQGQEARFWGSSRGDAILGRRPR